MTKKEIEDKVESWNNNMDIFEIFEELKENHTDGEQRQLLIHAYNDWNYPPMLKLLEELAYHFGIYSLKEEKELDAELWAV